MFTRRIFLRSSAIAVAGFGLAPSWLVRAAAQSQNRKKILVAIFQRGAADGLNIVAPFFEKTYYDLRPSIAVAAPGKPNGGIDLDGRFAFHPSLSAAEAFLGQRAIGHHSRRRLSEPIALALRRAGLHGVRHARERPAKAAG